MSIDAPPTHQHTCRVCHPELMPPSGDRIGEHHTGVRFGRSEARHLYVRVNGQPMGNVFEAIAGRPGRVWVYPNHIDANDHKMACCRTVPVDPMLLAYGRDSHPCVAVLVADVEIRTRLPGEIIDWTYYRV